MRAALIFCIVFAQFAAFGQDVQIIPGPEEIALNEVWTLKITASNEKIRKFDPFPDIKGFVKRGTSTESSTSVVNGAASYTQSIVMNYSAEKQGVISIPAFTMEVNGKKIQVTARKVKVGPPVQTRDPLASLFDRGNSGFYRQEPEYIDIQADAFFDLTTDKKEVYRGEGVNVILAFYIAETNRAPMNFYQLSDQLSAILKKIKPQNCWEENFNLETIQSESVVLKGKAYQRYVIYRSTFFPLNLEPLRFPSVEMEMIQYKIAKNPSFYGPNRKEALKKFATREKLVKVKQLPPHPLRDRVNVGTFQMEERMPQTRLNTGESSTYEFTIRGAGNISGIVEPERLPDSQLEIYEPSIQQNISVADGIVSGSKAFTYFVIPQQPGSLPLKKALQWVYFDPVKHKYDTLSPRVVLQVQGESKTDHTISSTEEGGFYDQTEVFDNTLQSSAQTFPQWIYQVVAGILFLSGVVVLIWRPAKR